MFFEELIAAVQLRMRVTGRWVSPCLSYTRFVTCSNDALVLRALVGRSFDMITHFEMANEPDQALKCNQVFNAATSRLQRLTADIVIERGALCMWKRDLI